MSKESPITPGGDCVVIEGWTATYPDPIRVIADEPIALDGRADEWDGHRWLWACNRAGRVGWIPDCLVSTDAPLRALKAYDAVELSCRQGQMLEAQNVMHGWVWCVDHAANAGWVPARNLRAVDP